MNRAQALQLSLVFALKTLAGESSCGTESAIFERVPVQDGDPAENVARDV